MDEFLDQFMEDHINGGYGDLLDQLAAEECLEHGEQCGLDFNDEDGDYFGKVFDDDCPLDGDHETGLRDAGFGTDEDYGYFGGDDDFGDW